MTAAALALPAAAAEEEKIMLNQYGAIISTLQRISGRGGMDIYTCVCVSENEREGKAEAGQLSIQGNHFS